MSKPRDLAQVLFGEQTPLEIRRYVLVDENQHPFLLQVERVGDERYLEIRNLDGTFLEDGPRYCELHVMAKRLLDNPVGAAGFLFERKGKGHE